MSLPDIDKTIAYLQAAHTSGSKLADAIALLRRMQKLAQAEHIARCDLIDALFYVDIVRGVYGFPPTKGEQEMADNFHAGMSKRYPQQKKWHTPTIEPPLEDV